MLNVVFFMGELGDIDEEKGDLRYVSVVGDFRNVKGVIQNDLIPVVNWTKTSKGELFLLNKGSLVLIKGRLEIINQKCVVVCENLSYLGKK